MAGVPAPRLRSRVLRCAAGVGLLVAAAGGSLSAQLTDSTLALASRLATEGRGDSARALVRAKLRELGPTDSLIPEVLYTAAVVAESADSAIYYLRRVTIEHPRSVWAEHGLLRLAQLAYAAGDQASAKRALDRLLFDYPASELRAQGNFWAARIELDAGNLSEACRLLREAEQGAGDNIELLNRVRYHEQRCTVAAVDSAKTDTAPAPAVRYAVQIAAVQSAAAADQVMRQLAARGYEPRVVREADGLFRVRVGRFATREEAQRLAARLRTEFGGTPFVVEEQ